MADKAAGGLLPPPGQVTLQSKEGTHNPVSPASAAQDRHADSSLSAFTYKYSFSCKESAFSGLSRKKPSRWDHLNHHMGKIFQTTLMCSRMETLSAGLDLLEKVKTPFNFSDSSVRE